MIKVMHTDSGYMIRTNGTEYFFCFFQSLTDLVAFIKFSNIKIVFVDDETASLSDAIEISKQLDENFYFHYGSVVPRCWKGG